MKSDELKKEYDKVIPFYGRLANVVREDLESQLSQASIKPAALLYRVKEFSSFSKKVERKSYHSPFTQNEDFAGIRVVCLFEKDLDSVEKILRANYKITSNEDKAEKLGTDKMGYDARHFVIQLPNACSGPQYNNLHQFKCEIQVRTILQDAWAMINHELNYKDELSIPSSYRRDLNSVSVLLTISQQLFEKVLNKREEYKEELSGEKLDENVFLAQSVNYESLKAYSELRYPDKGFSEHIHSLLVSDMDKIKYPTLKAVDAVVKKAEPFVAEYYRQNPGVFKFGGDFLTKSFGYVDDEFLRKHPFAKFTKDAISRYKAQGKM